MCRSKASVWASGLTVILAGGLLAATTGTQSFTLTVPSVLSITAPSAATATHDGTNANQAFSAQAWQVDQNQILGATANFAVATPFIHGTNATIKRNCKLAIAVGSSDTGSGWTATVANDQTDYANAIPKNTATVTAVSTAAGKATLNLTVTFLDTLYSALPTGSYSVTVTGTVAANL